MSLWPLDHVTFRPVAMAGAKLVFNVENEQVKRLSLANEREQDRHNVRDIDNGSNRNYSDSRLLTHLTDL